MRYFIAVADERNFTRAARRLNISQSPLSHQIRSVEREMQVRLFIRTTRSVSLTQAGEVFYERAAQVLAAFDDAIEASKKAARGHLGQLSIGFTSSATFELLPQLARTYADRYPDVSLEVHSDLTTSEQTAALLEGRLSVGVLRPPVVADGLAVETIRREPVAVLLANRHPRTVDREINLADLRDEWFISQPDNPPTTMHQVLINACQLAGFVPKVHKTAGGSAGLMALVAGDIGVALVPYSLRHMRIDGVTFRPLRTPPVTVSLALAYRETNISPLIRQFLETVRGIVRSRNSVEPSVTPLSEDDPRVAFDM